MKVNKLGIPISNSMGGMVTCIEVVKKVDKSYYTRFIDDLGFGIVIDKYLK